MERLDRAVERTEERIGETRDQILEVLDGLASQFSRQARWMRDNPEMLPVGISLGAESQLLVQLATCHQGLSDTLRMLKRLKQGA